MRFLLLSTLALAAAFAQDKPADPLRISGVDAGSKIQYTLLSVEGTALGPVQPASPPRLTAQCTKDSAGKLHFELLADEGGAPPLKYFAPWKPTKDDIYAPRLVGVTVTMEYLGYVKEKPQKRQWDRLDQMREVLMYSPPGLGSHNLEDVRYPLQYMRSLPRLHLAIPGRPVLEFETLAWQAKVRAEPLCGASGL